MNKQTAKISTSGTAIVSMPHGYSRNAVWYGSFSTTTELLVYYSRSLWRVPASVSWPGTTWSQAGGDEASGSGGGTTSHHS